MALALTVTAAAPPALVVLVVQNWVDVPWMDEWDIADIVCGHHEGTLQFKYLFAQHNEHRLLFPRLITVGVSLISRWDLRWEMALSILMSVAILGGIGRLLWIAGPAAPCSRWVLLMLTSLVVFSPVQWANWLMGMQFAVFMPPLFLVIGLRIVLSRRSLWLKTGVNRLLAFLATYSFGHGMIVWGLIAPLEFAATLRRRKESLRRALPLAWYVSAGAASVILYFHDYHPPLESHPSAIR